jgi:hypothetical protein
MSEQVSPLSSKIEANYDLTKADNKLQPLATALASAEERLKQAKLDEHGVPFTIARTKEKYHQTQIEASKAARPALEESLASADPILSGNQGRILVRLAGSSDARMSFTLQEAQGWLKT